MTAGEGGREEFLFLLLLLLVLSIMMYNDVCNWVVSVDGGCGDVGSLACWEDCSCDAAASMRGVAENGEAPSCNC